MSSSACFLIASTTLGWQCPAIPTQKPAVRSTYRFPSTSMTFAPLACFQDVGVSPIRTGERVGVSYSPSTEAIVFEFGPGGSTKIRGRSLPNCSSTCKTFQLLASSVLPQKTLWFAFQSSDSRPACFRGKLRCQYGFDDFAIV